MIPFVIISNCVRVAAHNVKLKYLAHIMKTYRSLMGNPNEYDTASSMKHSYTTKGPTTGTWYLRSSVYNEIQMTGGRIIEPQCLISSWSLYRQMAVGSGGRGSIWLRRDCLPKTWHWNPNVYRKLTGPVGEHWRTTQAPVSLSPYTIFPGCPDDPLSSNRFWLVSKYDSSNNGRNDIIVNLQLLEWDRNSFPNRYRPSEQFLDGIMPPSVEVCRITQICQQLISVVIEVLKSVSFFNR